MKQSERVINRFLTWFDPILLTDWDEAIWIRILENSRLFGFNGKPVGGEPDEIVNDKHVDWGSKKNEKSKWKNNSFTYYSIHCFDDAELRRSDWERTWMECLWNIEWSWF